MMQLGNGDEVQSQQPRRNSCAILGAKEKKKHRDGTREQKELLLNMGIFTQSSRLLGDFA